MNTAQLAEQIDLPGHMDVPSTVFTGHICDDQTPFKSIERSRNEDQSNIFQCLSDELLRLH